MGMFEGLLEAFSYVVRMCSGEAAGLQLEQRGLMIDCGQMVRPPGVARRVVYRRVGTDARGHNLAHTVFYHRTGHGNLHLRSYLGLGGRVRGKLAKGNCRAFKRDEWAAVACCMRCFFGTLAEVTHSLRLNVDV